ncbi:MAG: MoaD/ThiS family protein [Verrucomicrobiales bacterium]
MNDEPPIRVLFFSAVRDAVGGLQETTVNLKRDLPSGVVLGDLIAWLEEKFPKLEGWRGRLLLAVDQEYAEPSTSLRPGQEIALMPPVQGG